MIPDRAPVCRRSGSRPARLIPEWHFDVAGLSPRQCIEAWHEACAGFYDVTMDVDAAIATRAAFAWHRLDDLMFSSGVSFPHVARRKGEHVTRQKNFVRLLFAPRGGTRILAGEQCAELGSGMIHLIDYSRPYIHLRSEAIDLNGVYVPHEAIGYDPSRHPAYMCVGTETPIGQVLSGAFFALSDQLGSIDMTEAPALATGLSDLIRALMLRDATHERGLKVVRSARREAMRAFIERNLRDPALGIDSLCRNFGASRATIYRDFAPVGGVAEYVMGRRLERALADLVDGPRTRGAVTATAESWGFESLSHFSRRFRERFGVAPSDVVGLAASVGAPGDEALAASGLEAAGFERRGRLASWFALTS